MRPTSRQALTNDFGLKWARCLPHMGNVLAPVGQRACPTWARSVRDPCPKHVRKYQYGKSKPNHYDLPQKHQTKYHKNTKRFPRNYKQNTSKT